MANVKILLPFILAWEGGFSNHKNDRGGATNKGVTLTVWKSQGYDKDGDGDIDVEDLKAITDDDVCNRILVPGYWNRWRADQINCQSIANLVVDWVWCSGRHGIVNVQKVLGVTADGIVGPKTIAAINNHNDQHMLFLKIWNARYEFLNGIAKRDPSQRVFLNGWRNRLASMRWGLLEYRKKVWEFKP